MNYYKILVSRDQRDNFIKALNECLRDYSFYDWTHAHGAGFIYEFRLPESDFLILKLKVQFKEIKREEGI